MARISSATVNAPSATYLLLFLLLSHLILISCEMKPNELQQRRPSSLPNSPSKENALKP